MQQRLIRPLRRSKCLPSSALADKNGACEQAEAKKRIESMGIDPPMATPEGGFAADAVVEILTPR